MTKDGLLCTWTGFGSMARVDCSGYSLRAGEYVNYSCDYYFYGGSGMQWTCRSTDGATWSGSR